MGIPGLPGGIPRGAVGEPGVHIYKHWLLLLRSAGVVGFGSPKGVHTCTHWLLLSATTMRPALDVEIPCKLVNSPFSRPRLPAGTGQGGNMGPQETTHHPVNPCHPLGPFTTTPESHEEPMEVPTVLKSPYGCGEP